MNEETKIEAALCQQAIGLYVNIDGNTNKIIESLINSTAEHIIEVLVKFNGKTKEFTFVDFFTRLGFEM